MNLYTAKERRGLTTLLILCAALLLVYYLLPFVIKQERYDYTEFYQQIKDMSDATEVTNDPLPLPRIEPFDVNEVGYEELQQYGLSKSVAKIWINYRKAIGGFKDQKQLSKIYGLDSNWLKENRDNLLIKEEAEKTTPKTKYWEETSTSDPTFTFDPNTADQDDLERAGLDSQSIASLLKYQEKGGTIYRPEEVAFLAGMDQETYHQLSASINIEADFLPKLIGDENDRDQSFVAAKISNNTGIQELDINQSNEYQWQQLKGIGPYYARSIIKYRNQLGGFTSVDQVAETYHLPDSVFSSIKAVLRTSPVNKLIYINQINADSLRLHPYINWKQASILINYRKNHGPYQEIADFYKIRVFDSVFVQKIEPYISF